MSRWYTPAYVAPSGRIVAIGSETVWLTGAMKEAAAYQRDADAEVFVAYRDIPRWERLSDEQAAEILAKEES